MLIVPEPAPASKSETFAVRGFAVLTVLAAFVYSFFMDRTPVFDEIGLYNPIYMYLHYGKMTYPAHGQFEFMVVHPPFHYAVIALLMKLGLNLFHAAGVPVFLLSLISIGLIVQGRFPSTVKLGLMAALFCTFFIWGEFYSVRPDLHLALAWFTGLIALESARTSNWSAPKLFLGSFFSTYASGVHYWGAPAFVAVLVYAGLMVWQVGVIKSRLKLLAMLAGACLFGIPYLLLFVVPYWSDIRVMIGGVQGAKGPVEAFLRHLASYEAFRLRFDWSTYPLITLLTYPIFQFKIPAIFIATPLLLISPFTRGLALAGAVIPLFVLFYSQGKQVGYTGYFTPEVALYFSGLLITVMLAIERLFSFITSRKLDDFTTLAAATIFTVFIFTSVPVSLGSPIRLTSNLADLDVARASAREIVGPDALVGVNSAGIWYTAGETHWYQPWTDLTYPKYTSVNLPAYLSQFDALAIDNSWWNNQTKAVPIPSWYANDQLKLKGVFFSFKNPEEWSLKNPVYALSYLFLSTNAPERVIGYGYRNGTLYRFDEQSAGDAVFMTAVCPSFRAIQSSEFFSSIYIDQPLETAPHLMLSILSRKDYDAQRSAITSECKLRDEIWGELKPVDKQDFLSRFYQNDQTIQFHRILSEAIAARKQ